MTDITQPSKRSWVQLKEMWNWSSQYKSTGESNLRAIDTEAVLEVERRDPKISSLGNAYALGYGKTKMSLCEGYRGEGRCVKGTFENTVL